jgi:hypothetical protein
MEETMKQLIAAVCFMLAATPFALAQDKAKDTKAPVAEKSTKADAPKKEPSEKQKAQQERMKDCSGKAGDRKGDERKKFMSSCLKGEDMGKSGTSDKQSAQQGKMKSCNKEAGEKKMKGDERKSFMKDCLSK